MARNIVIDPITRIEGHAKVEIDINDDQQVNFARLHVNELRGFEKILTGMKVEEMPLITARICGVCPAAHHLASVRALDRAFAVEPPSAAHMIRELMYLGHIIHSHTLSLFVLSGPDLIMGLAADPAQRNIQGMAAADPDTIKKVLRLRSIGQKILESLGARGVHPVTAVAGGVTFRLEETKRRALLELAGEAMELVDFAGSLIKKALADFLEQHPLLSEKLDLATHYLGTVKNGKLNFYDGVMRVIDNRGGIVAEFDAADYADHIFEETLPHSYMKPTFLHAPGGGDGIMYRVNTLARINVAEGMETPRAQAELEEFRSLFGRPCHNTVTHHHARLIELLYACEKALALLRDDAITGSSRVPLENTPQNAVAHVEAPRGSLIHDYTVNEQGVIESANLLVATQQNYAAINETIKQAAEYFLTRSEEELLGGIEFTIRTYDPCLSCATHATGHLPLEVSVVNNGQIVKTIRR